MAGPSTSFTDDDEILDELDDCDSIFSEIRFQNEQQIIEEDRDSDCELNHNENSSENIVVNDGNLDAGNLDNESDVFGLETLGDRYVGREGESWHSAGGSSGGGPIKSFSSRETWVSGSTDRKPEHMSEAWSRTSSNSSRWPGGTAPIGMSSRSGGQGGMSSSMFATNSIPIVPGMGMSNMGPFSGGDRFDAYKQPYFKGP
ncbi:hypothetical protein J6590_083248 [Homalodisca vitripennis]|nr:hypothetical protein J6590_083248 [Homalodisca vitripennis]